MRKNRQETGYARNSRYSDLLRSGDFISPIKSSTSRPVELSIARRRSHYQRCPILLPRFRHLQSVSLIIFPAIHNEILQWQKKKEYFQSFLYFAASWNKFLASTWPVSNGREKECIPIWHKSVSASFSFPLFLSNLGYQPKRMQKGEFGEGME